MSQKPIASSEAIRRAEWRQRLLDTVHNPVFDLETKAELIDAGFDEAYAEGVSDAADICETLAKDTPSVRLTAVTIARGIRRLTDRKTKENSSTAD